MREWYQIWMLLAYAGRRLLCGSPLLWDKVDLAAFIDRRRPFGLATHVRAH